MTVYVLPWEQGPRGFRPQGVDQLAGFSWSCIDLRSDPTQQAGRCILGTAGIIDVSGIGNGRLLGANLDATVPAAVRLVLRTALGLTATDLPDVTPRTIIRRLLTGLGREDGTRWRNLIARRFGANDYFEAYLNDELVFQDVVPVVQGGAVYTENFNTGDGTTLGPTLTWTEVDGAWSIASNRARIDTAAGADVHGARAESDAATTDQYSQVEMYAAAPTATAAGGGPSLRYSSSAHTCYHLFAGFDSGSNHIEIDKIVTGTSSTLASTSITGTSGGLIRLEAFGSGLVAYYAGARKTSCTDTSITTGTRGGIGAYDVVGGLLTFDNFEFGDFAGIQVSGVSPTASVSKADIQVSAVIDGTAPTASTSSAGPLLSAVVDGSGPTAAASSAEALLGAVVDGSAPSASASSATAIVGGTVVIDGSSPSASTSSAFPLLSAVIAGTAPSASTSEATATLTRPAGSSVDYITPRLGRRRAFATRSHGLRRNAPRVVAPPPPHSPSAVTVEGSSASSSSSTGPPPVLSLVIAGKSATASQSGASPIRSAVVAGVSATAAAGTATADTGSSTLPSGNILWVKGDAGVTGSSNVSAWADQSTGNHNFSQPTGANQPATNTRTINSINAVDFQTGDWMDTDAISLAQPFTICGEFILDTPSNTMEIVGAADDSWYLFVTGDTYFLGAGGTEIGGGTTDALAHRFCIVVNGASSAIYIDDFTTPIATGNPGSLGSTGAVRVGAGAGGSASLNGGVPELMAFNSALNSTNRGIVKDYLTTRYAGGGGGGGGGTGVNELWANLAVYEVSQLVNSTQHNTSLGLSEMVSTFDGADVSHSRAWRDGPTDWSNVNVSGTFYDMMTLGPVMIAAGLPLRIGGHIGKGGPPDVGNATELTNWVAFLKNDVDAAVAMGAQGIFWDGEPYAPGDAGSYEGHSVDSAAWVAALEEVGAYIRDAGLDLRMYLASTCYWPGSNNDEIQFQNSGNHYYGDNRWQDVMRGLDNTTGLNYGIYDASWHHQMQNSIPNTYEEGVQRCIDLTTNTIATSAFATKVEFPNCLVSIMGWPDLMEPANSYWTSTEITEIYNAALTTGTCGTSVYDWWLVSWSINFGSPYNAVDSETFWNDTGIPALIAARP